ncbi:MAG: nitrous oxide reductase accessory protein NosL [Kiloniellaceae bacterium]
MAILLPALLLAACNEEVAKAPPAPVALTEDSLAHYCQMWIADHGGPKAQIHLEGTDAPLFFAQVRDAVAYLRSPERSAPVIAVYVSDMARAASWEHPGADNWIAADKAAFVVGSDVKGGMGAPEVAPFGTRDAAERFMRDHGGRIMTLDQIPAQAVLGAVDFDLPGETAQ